MAQRSAPEDDTADKRSGARDREHAELPQEERRRQEKEQLKEELEELEEEQQQKQLEEEEEEEERKREKGRKEEKEREEELKEEEIERERKEEGREERKQVEEREKEEKEEREGNIKSSTEGREKGFGDAEKNAEENTRKNAEGNAQNSWEGGRGATRDAGKEAGRASGLGRVDSNKWGGKKADRRRYSEGAISCPDNVELGSKDDPTDGDTGQSADPSCPSQKPLERRNSDPLDLVKVRDLFKEALQEGLEENDAELLSSPVSSPEKAKPLVSRGKPPLPHSSKFNGPDKSSSSARIILNRDTGGQNSLQLLGFAIGDGKDESKSESFMPKMNSWSYGDFKESKILTRKNKLFSGGSPFIDKYKSFLRRNKQKSSNQSIEKIIKKIKAHEAAQKANEGEDVGKHRRSKSLTQENFEALNFEMVKKSLELEAGSAGNQSQIQDPSGASSDKGRRVRFESDLTPEKKEVKTSSPQIERLIREKYYRVKHDKIFSEWKILVGPDDWKNYNHRRPDAEKYHFQNLPSYMGPGIYELGLTIPKSKRRLKPRHVTVVYVGQAENIRQRIQQYGQTGSHLENKKKGSENQAEDGTQPIPSPSKIPNSSPKDENHHSLGCFGCGLLPSPSETDLGRDLELGTPTGPGLFTKAFDLNYAVVFRWAKVANKARALEAETKLLTTFDYAWNHQQNGNRRPGQGFSRAKRRFPQYCGFVLSLFPPKPVGVQLEVNRSAVSVEVNERKHRGSVSTLSNFSWSTDTSKDKSSDFSSAHKYNEYIKEHEAKEAAANDPTLGGRLCGADIGDGETCPRKPLPRRKRCALHKGVRVSQKSIHNVE